MIFVCDGRGENRLGEALMAERDAVRERLGLDSVSGLFRPGAPCIFWTPARARPTRVGTIGLFGKEAGEASPRPHCAPSLEKAAPPWPI